MKHVAIIDAARYVSLKIDTLLHGVDYETHAVTQEYLRRNIGIPMRGRQNC